MKDDPRLRLSVKMHSPKYLERDVVHNSVWQTYTIELSRLFGGTLYLRQKNRHESSSLLIPHFSNSTPEFQCVDQSLPRS